MNLCCNHRRLMKLWLFKINLGDVLGDDRNNVNENVSEIPINVGGGDLLCLFSVCVGDVI